MKFFFISSFHTTFIYSSVILTTFLLNLHFGINSLPYSGCHYYEKLLNWASYADDYNGITFQSVTFTQFWMWPTFTSDSQATSNACRICQSKSVHATITLLYNKWTSLPLLIIEFMASLVMHDPGFPWKSSTWKLLII